MATQRILYKGKKELTMAEYEALTSEDSAVDYDITDYPQESITNSEMTYALTCKKLFPEGTVKICSDNGTYTQGKLYQIVVSGGVKSWKDITSSINLNYSEFSSNEYSGDMWLGNGQKTISMAQMITSGTTNTNGAVGIDKSGSTMIGYFSGTETESYGSTQKFSNTITFENIHQINDVVKSTKILVSEDNTTIQSINGETTKTIKITSTGTTIDDKEIATTDMLPDTSKLLTIDTAQDVTGVKTYKSAPELYNQIPIYGTIGSGAGKQKYRLLEYYQTASNVHWVEVGSSSQYLNLVGNTPRPSYSTTEHSKGNYLALYSDVPSVEQSTGTSTTATMSQNSITSSLSSKADVTKTNAFTASQIFQGSVTFGSYITLSQYIVNSNGYRSLTTNDDGDVTLGDTHGSTTIQGKGDRPNYNSKQLALYNDIPNYFTTAGSTGGNTSGGLKLTAGHLYRIYVGMGDAILSCLVKMPIPMVEQYWFWGMNLYNHYCRLHISSAGVVTYQYANVGQTNWTNNNSVYITYEDITSKS